MLSPTEEIKQRLDVAEVIGGYVKLHKAGVNMKGLCPFHGEKTPSFMVSKQKQMWHCFGCSQGGDLFSFIMKIEGLEFVDALHLLADRAGVALPQYDPKLKSARSGMIAVLESARDFFSRSLFSTAGIAVRQYLGKRGLDEKTVRRFGLGYAPNSWDALLQELSKTYKPQDIFAAGLLVRKDDHAVVGSQSSGVSHYYDRFRHRLMFPISDAHGNVVGFTGRILDDTQQGGKYVNTPETAVYNKSRILYALDLAKGAIREKDAVVIMEGNMDAITAHQFGFNNTVASSGTALTADQLRLIERFTKNIILAFDADAAGQAAMKRGIDLAQAEGMRVRVAELPEGSGKDPDDCIRKDAARWAKAVESAEDIMRWYFKKARKAYNRDSPQGRKDFAIFVLSEIARLSSAVERDFWLKQAADDLNVAQAVIEEEFRQVARVVSPIRPQPLPQKTAVNAASAVLPRRAMLEERLLSLLAAHKEMIARMGKNARAVYFADAPRRALFEKLISPSPVFSPEERGVVDLLELRGEKDFGDWEEKKLEEEAAHLSGSLRDEHLKERRTELTRAMREAEHSGNRDTMAAISKAFDELNATL